MKQIGNLAIVCARRRDTLLQVMDGKATVFVGHGPNRTSMSADWHDDEKILRFVLELNYGRFREEIIEKGAKSA